ncbi:hypothetical protein CRENBAI_008755 [Crenichthys baileyi]|uniref:Uncharacterized protein n=1 Tax=Crenichthys baileyi TaxID=28760 RepID=A0AAV9SG10_9TELE
MGYLCFNITFQVTSRGPDRHLVNGAGANTENMIGHEVEKENAIFTQPELGPRLLPQAVAGESFRESGCSQLKVSVRQNPRTGRSTSGIMIGTLGFS